MVAIIQMLLWGAMRQRPQPYFWVFAEHLDNDYVFKGHVLHRTILATVYSFLYWPTSAALESCSAAPFFLSFFVLLACPLAALLLNRRGQRVLARG